ncbi:proton-conducting membrane transporter [Halobium salinum]|uniref:Proton-conducting membrane transporter n=1 Tax=Halobium salinum TaxID=1364940 RepID=A0ABD5PGP1_9EURY|nr:proton-conducting membrane transporter [Halobium salinum]
MTDKPSLNTGGNLVQGLAAVALFVVLAIVFLGASFPEPAGFPDGTNVVGSIGYSMFNITGMENTVPGEGMVVALEVMGLVLVGALAGAILLARREADGRSLTALVTDGGRTRKETETEEGEQ